LDELEKLVNSIREKREDDRKKLRSELIPQIELGNDSPSQQIAQNSISSTVINTTTINVIQQDSKKNRYVDFRYESIIFRSFNCDYNNTGNNDKYKWKSFKKT
jgi:hypothetical protein